MKNEKFSVMEIAGQTMCACKNMMQSGLKFQEEAWQRCSALFNPAACALEAQKCSNDVAGIVDKAMPTTQKSIEDAWEFMEKNAQAGACLVKKASDAAQASLTPESQALWMDFIESSLRTTRSNADTLMNIQIQAVNMWMELLQQRIQMPQSQSCDPLADKVVKSKSRG